MTENSRLQRLTKPLHYHCANPARSKAWNRKLLELRRLRPQEAIYLTSHSCSRRSGVCCPIVPGMSHGPCRGLALPCQAAPIPGNSRCDVALLVATEIFEPVPAPTAPSIWSVGGTAAAPFGDLALTGTNFPGFRSSYKPSWVPRLSPRAGVTADRSRLPPVACWPRVTGSDEYASQAADEPRVALRGQLPLDHPD